MSPGIQQKYIIVTCNYVAREIGVTKLMSVINAKEKCPQLVLVKGEDLTHYREMSYKVTGRPDVTTSFKDDHVYLIKQYLRHFCIFCQKNSVLHFPSFYTDSRNSTLNSIYVLTSCVRSLSLVTLLCSLPRGVDVLLPVGGEAGLR